MSYALDRLGWLQFQDLCARLLQLDAAVAPSAWSGDADRVRIVRCEDGLGAPLLGYQLPGPVLVQCAWARASGGALAAVLRLVEQQPLDGIRSLMLLTEAELEGGLELPAGLDRTRVGILGARELSARIDALAQLRLQVPSLLGLRDIEELLDAETVAGSSLELGAARELAGVFAPTRAYQRALSVLEAHRFVVLTGPPEMGKTAIARMVALAKLTDGWQAHECISPDDAMRAFDGDRAQVFVADDAFGSTEYRADAADHWARAMQRLLPMLNDRHWLIWTSRPAPLRAALARLHRERGAARFPEPARVLVDAGDLEVSEKALILLRHAKAAGLATSLRTRVALRGAEIVSDDHFTPERIRRLVLALTEGVAEFKDAVETQLSTPTEAMANSFQALADEHRDLLVALLDTPPGPVGERELAAAVRRHRDGPLSEPPAELIDRLADHFLRVLA
ncbi:MAG: hypothetical protein ACRDMX_12190 [Solirubrobacteraceae bacterium]